MSLFFCMVLHLFHVRKGLGMLAIVDTDSNPLLEWRSGELWGSFVAESSSAMQQEKFEWSHDIVEKMSLSEQQKKAALVAGGAVVGLGAAWGLAKLLMKPKPLSGKAATAAIGGKPHFEYLDLPATLGGRGGVVRLFFIVHGIEYTEKLHAMGDPWLKRKQELIASGENPCGFVPLVKIGNDLYTEHISMLRFFSRKLGTYGKCAKRDYYEDAIADEYQPFRDGWVNSVIGSEEQKAEYKKKRFDFYRVLETLYAQRKKDKSKAYLNARDVPGFVDIAMFALLRDDTIFNGDPFADAKYPNLKAVYDTVGALPQVKAYYESIAPKK
jgi:glutathione S-transferase